MKDRIPGKDEVDSATVATGEDACIPRRSSYWNTDCCPACGSAEVELFTYKENEHEYVQGTCQSCGHQWKSIRNDWGC